MSQQQLLSGFNPNRPKYDQSHFLGRLRHFMDITDPTTLLTPEARLQESLRLLQAYQAGTLPLPPNPSPAELKAMEERLWRAKKLKDAILHPDTGEKIPMPFRMSGFVPFGSITVIGMLLPNPTVPSIIFWQWLNQTHNAAVNYCNRNASSPTPTRTLVESYLGASGTAVGVALALDRLVARASSFSNATRFLIQRFVPFPAVASANVANVVLMRRQELEAGIHVKDKDGNVLGTSQAAAKKAIFETALTRIALPFPLLVFPPMIMARLEKTSLLRKFPRLHLPVQASVCIAAFGIALPIAISLFPQDGSMPLSELEAPLAERILREKKGAVESDSVVYYNKGL
ncbi:Sideroflexin-5 [Balamuthia mandrillaris]